MKYRSLTGVGLAGVGLMLAMNAWAAGTAGEVHLDAVKQDPASTMQRSNDKKPTQKTEQYKMLNTQFLGKRPYVDKVKDTSIPQDQQH